MSQLYKESGVSLQAGYESVEKIKKHVNATQIKGAMDSLGAFGGMFALHEYDYKEPILVSGTDGVGTKILCAIETKCHDTIGIDAVAMCVNDILVQGAKPLFFLDYLALHQNQPDEVAAIVEGIAKGCQQAKCALIGGETAEMRDLYEKGHYDLAGFCVGVVEKRQLIRKGMVQEGDVMIGLASSGLHSNGYSLVRKILFKDHHLQYEDQLGSKTVKEHVLTPTRIYVPAILALLEQVKVHGMSHITGGGFYENIERALPAGLKASIDATKIATPEIFQHIQTLGQIPTKQMYQVFNMGIGFVVMVAAQDVKTALMCLEAQGESAMVLGTITKGEGVEIQW